MKKDMFKRIFKRRDAELYSWIYEVPFSCLVPISSTIHPIERNLAVTPVLKMKKEDLGYGYFGESEEIEIGSSIMDEVDDMFSGYEETVNTADFALNRQTKVSITILKMAQLYEDGNYVYLTNEKDLKKVYGLLESFITYKLKYYNGPNTGNGIANDSDLHILDRLATSMVKVYQEDDSELYYESKGTRGKLRDMLGARRNKGRRVEKRTIRSKDRVVIKVSQERLDELGY